MLKILLVEDDFLIRSNTAEILMEFGYEVIESSNGQQALAELAGTEIDLLLTDIGLPDISGGELVQRAIAMKPELAIVFATGENHKPEGAPPEAGLLRKPYNEQDIVRAIESVTAGR